MKRNGAFVPVPLIFALAAALLLGPAVIPGASHAQEGEPREVTAEDEPVGAGVAASDEEQAAEAGSLDYTLLELIRFGGVIGYVIIGLSLVAMALMIDDALLLRRKILVPPAEVSELRRLIETAGYDEISSRAPWSSFVGATTAAGVAERSRGYEAVVKAMEDSADELTGRLLRRIEYLNLIANVTPMLGLLGTVVGMVRSFNTISVAAGGADPRLLAAGIFQALMTTVMGLTVAIPTLFAFGLFRNRVDGLVAEASATAEDLVRPLREHETPPPALSQSRG